MGFGVTHRVGDSARRRRRGGGVLVPELPAGAYHHANYLADNTTLASGRVTNALEFGTVGGGLAQSMLARRPGVATVNGKQYVTLNYDPVDGLRDHMQHSTAASAWPFGADTDDPFSFAALFLVGASGTTRYICGTMTAVTASSQGFFARVDANNAVTVGKSPAGQAAWHGLATSPVQSAGWHVLVCEWGNGTYAHYIDDMVTPFASGSYTYSGTGGDPPIQLMHGTQNLDGVIGFGGMALYERKTLGAADRNQMQNALRADLGLAALPLA